LTFRQATGIALELADQHRAATIGLVVGLDPWPGSRSATPGAAEEAMLPTLCSLLERARAPADQAARTDPADDGPAGGCLLITIERDRPLLPPVDIGLFRWATATFGSSGWRLHDWIHTDGDLVRSAAYAVDPRRAWPDDPPHERLIDQIVMGSDLPEPSTAGQRRARPQQEQ
jgi:hypothetical protein